jgi:hypothetical protein
MKIIGIMIFSAGEYTGTVHPDWDTHRNFVPQEYPSETPWDLTVYGSLYDYWNEVSNHNLQVQAYPTRSGGSGKYYNGIVNKIDAAGGRNYVRWIMLPYLKSVYESGDRDPIADALAEVDRLHYSVDTTDPDYIEFPIRAYPPSGRIGIVAAGGSLGGWVRAIGDASFIVTEKTHGFTNRSPGAILDGIQEDVHEFGHTIGFPHFIGGSYETMHWRGLGHRRHYWCPPHMNPLSKILAGWIPESNIHHVRQNNILVSLPPVHNTNVIAIVDVYGEAGRNGNYKDHSEYLLVEYRKREGFNRFAGGPTVQDKNFDGGALIWHYSTIRSFPISGASVEARLGLKVAGYGQSFAGNPGSPDHFYPYHGTPLDPNSNPNSNSTSDLSTGISLNTFQPSGGFLSFYVNYLLGAPPNYAVFLFPTSPGATQWNDSVYVQGQHDTPQIAPTAYVEVAGGIQVSQSIIGSSSSPIRFVGVGYSTNRVPWGGIRMVTTNPTTVPEMKHCLISNAVQGVIVSASLDGNGIFPTPRVRSCTFTSCQVDIRVQGRTGGGTIDYAVELSGLDSNTYSSIIVSQRTKLTQSDFTVPSNGRLIFDGGGPLIFRADVKLSNRNMNILGETEFRGNVRIDGSTWRFSNSVVVPMNSAVEVMPGNEKGKIEDGSMSLISPLMRQIFRERQRGNFAAAEGLIRSAINNRNVPEDVKLWALGQMLAVGQRRRNANLASFFNSLTNNPTLGRKARALLPMSFMHEGSLTQAIAAYDANVRDYPNSSEARSGLYGKFAHKLYHEGDTTQARALLNRLAASYPQSVEQEIAEVQMSALRFSSSPSSNSTGGIAKGEGAGSATSSLRSIPTEFALSQNYPNPFNPMTTINFDVPVATHVTITLFDVLGREVQTLLNENVEAGYRQVPLDAGSLSSGLYFYRMQAGGFVSTRKAIVLK